jgi:hypothetical protein
MTFVLGNVAEGMEGFPFFSGVNQLKPTKRALSADFPN